MENAQVDTVVFEAPALQYYASHLGLKKVRTVGPLFRKESYGISLPDGSPYRDQINQALLAMLESGEYDAIYASWFGETPQ